MKITYDNYSIRKKNDGTLVKYPNPQFKTLNKIVLKGQDLPDLTQYYGSDQEIIGLTDFNEYGWEFIVEKLKYNDKFILNNLSDQQKEEIGYKMNDIEILEKTFFPTIKHGEDIDEPKISYFGTLSAGKQKLMIVHIPKKYEKAEIYDTTDNEETPKITITLEGNEILYSKLVWFVITAGGKESITDFNLSHISWENNINPHRNMNSYLLRNDERAKLDATVEVVENIKFSDSDPLWVDLSSSTIVGNKYIVPRYIHYTGYEKSSEEGPEIWTTEEEDGVYPILTLMLKSLENDITWDKHIAYRLGDIVSYHGSEWRSLKDKNLANYPDLSNSWALKDTLDGYKASRVVVNVVNIETDYFDEPGQVSPEILTMRSGSNNITFDVQYMNNYILADVDRDLENYNYYRLEKKEPFKVTMNVPSGSTDFNINFKKPKCNVFGIITNGFEGEESKLEGDNIPYLGDEYTIDIPSTSNKIIKSITKSYYLGSDDYSSPPQDKEEFQGSAEIVESPITGGTAVRIKDIAKYPCNIKYEVLVSNLIRKVSVIEHIGFFVDYKEQEVEEVSHSKCDVNFVPIDGDMSKINMRLNTSARDIVLDDSIEGNAISITDSLGTSILLTRNEGYYTLNIGNVQTDYEIKVWK